MSFSSFLLPFPVHLPFLFSLCMRRATTKHLTTGWAGHYRGSNATSETVICDLSYELRRPLAGLCMHGYTVSQSKTNLYWASDLLHRLLHIPQLAEGVIDHYEGGDDYEGVLELAKTKPEDAVRNSDTLQYFALEVYAHDVAVPGVGCVGEEEHDHDHDEVSSTTVTASATKATVTKTAAPSATKTPTPEELCEPHGDHW